MVKTYDPKCGELAEHFLSDLWRDPPKGVFPKSLADEKSRCEDLALHIQQAIEDWFSNFEDGR